MVSIPRGKGFRRKKTQKSKSQNVTSCLEFEVWLLDIICHLCFEFCNFLDREYLLQGSLHKDRFTIFKS